jgi:hypothetical protein
LAVPRRKPYAVVIPPAVQRQVDKLAGLRTGYGETLAQLRLDPCNLGAPPNPPIPKAYRLSGPLQPVVCGTHLRRGYRLAYTVQDDPEAAHGKRVVILYVGKKDDPAYQHGNDVWDLVHDLFGVANPPTNHRKPPCCERDWPSITDDQLDEFLASLSAFQRRTT